MKPFPLLLLILAALFLLAPAVLLFAAFVWCLLWLFLLPLRLGAYLFGAALQFLGAVLFLPVRILGGSL
jgi:hypothetical protein